MLLDLDVWELTMRIPSDTNHRRFPLMLRKDATRALVALSCWSHFLE